MLKQKNKNYFGKLTCAAACLAVFSLALVNKGQAETYFKEDVAEKAVDIMQNKDFFSLPTSVTGAKNAFGNLVKGGKVYTTCITNCGKGQTACRNRLGIKSEKCSNSFSQCKNKCKKKAQNQSK